MTTHKLKMMDGWFVQGESAENMMHVAGLMLFKLPKKSENTWLREVVEGFWAEKKVQPPFNYRLAKPDNLKALRHQWIEEDEVDLSYHVRRSALPSPGDEKELGILVSRLHSHSMDFHRPLWEMHFIEGLEDNRFAIFFKMHHALIDGVSGMKMLARSLSENPQEKNLTPLFAISESRRAARESSDSLDFMAIFSQALEGAMQQVGTFGEIGKALRQVTRSAIGKDELTIPYQAPNAIMNGQITRGRRFATMQLPLSKLKALGKKAGGSLNDIVLVLCGSALRRFLLELGALPSQPLTCMIPVNIRPADDAGGGNAVGSMYASLATDVADPLQRMHAILDSSKHAKEQLQGMSRQAIATYSITTMIPAALVAILGQAGKSKPPFNVVISNVPGPDKKLYFNGAELLAAYPLSIPMHGQAFNITLQTYADTLNFGFVGCSKTMPHLQRLALYTADALKELESCLD